MDGGQETKFSFWFVFLFLKWGGCPAAPLRSFLSLNLSEPTQGPDR